MGRRDEQEALRRKIATRLDERAERRRATVEHRDLTKARATIRKYDPDLADYLDLVMPVPTCPHGKGKEKWDADQGMILGKYYCVGCGIRLQGSGGDWYPYVPLTKSRMDNAKRRSRHLEQSSNRA